MSPVLTHSVLLNDRVRLTLTGDNKRQITATVPGAWLRAKCWGMLADLDPDGLVDAALGARNALLPATIQRAPLAAQILYALSTSPKTVGGIRVLLNNSANCISSRCGEMCATGDIERIDGRSGKGVRAIYQLTDQGRAVLQACGAIQ